MAESSDLENITKEISSIVLQIVQKYKASVDRKLRWYYTYSLDQLIRNLENFVVPLVSKEAQKKADALGLGELADFFWRDQPNRMNDKGRKIFHFEHMKPVADLRRQLVSLEAPTLEMVQSILMQTRVAWITKAENRRLKPFRRSSDPMEDYVQANISLVPIKSTVTVVHRSVGNAPVNLNKAGSETMRSIHFICRNVGSGLMGLTLIEQSINLYRSCCWRLTDQEADSLIGGWLYLHPSKKEPSVFGGRITRFQRVWDEGGAKRQDRVWLEFEARPEGRGQIWRGPSHRMAYTSRPIAADFPHERI